MVFVSDVTGDRLVEVGYACAVERPVGSVREIIMGEAESWSPGTGTEMKIRHEIQGRPRGR